MISCTCTLNDGVILDRENDCLTHGSIAMLDRAARHLDDQVSVAELAAGTISLPVDVITQLTHILREISKLARQTGSVGVPILLLACLILDDEDGIRRCTQN
jgi:hypothetical protein